jgi:secernin
MCDTFVALPSATANQSVIFAKSADCEVNEANALVRIPRQKHVPGEVVRLTHLAIPQAQETYEVILTKAFWTYGCEIGINEHGLAMGEEAVYTTQEKIDEKDGIIGPDLMRIGLERARTCREAVEIMTAMLEEHGQGGNCEMSGNSHFDSSFLLSDTQEACILETAGRDWAVHFIDDIGSISNMLSIRSNWDRFSREKDSMGRIDWAETYGRREVPPTLGSPDRQSITYSRLVDAKGKISVKTAFDIMRHHNEGYHPAHAPAHQNICVHAGPQENRWWQADGVMVTDVGDHGVMAWVTGTSGTCVSIFKPIFLGIELPDIGPLPTQNFNPDTLWWKHELLHRRAMADFDNVVTEIRHDFDQIEAAFVAAAETVKYGTDREKKEFTDYCFRKAMSATETWIERLRTRHNLTFDDPAYRAMWHKFNAQAGLTGMPA